VKAEKKQSTLSLALNKFVKKERQARHARISARTRPCVCEMRA
jgi:hypothetical protein